MNEQLSRRAAEVIAQIKYATVATVSNDGRPWSAVEGNYIDLRTEADSKRF